MTHLLPRLFFDHFQTTSFIVEDDGSLAAFLVGFVSQSHPKEAYIHFVGVGPEYRQSGLARQLYEKFFATVRCLTSPVNEASVAFHKRMGFSVSTGTDYAGPGQDRILFCKDLKFDGG